MMAESENYTRLKASTAGVILTFWGLRGRKSPSVRMDSPLIGRMIS